MVVSVVPFGNWSPTGQASLPGNAVRPLTDWPLGPGLSALCCVHALPSQCSTSELAPTPGLVLPYPDAHALLGDRVRMPYKTLSPVPMFEAATVVQLPDTRWSVRVWYSAPVVCVAPT